MQYHAIPCNTMQYHAIPCIINNSWRSVPLPCGQYNGHFYPFIFSIRKVTDIVIEYCIHLCIQGPHIEYIKTSKVVWSCRKDCIPASLWSKPWAGKGVAVVQQEGGLDHRASWNQACLLSQLEEGWLVLVGMKPVDPGALGQLPGAVRFFGLQNSPQLAASASWWALGSDSIECRSWSPPEVEQSLGKSLQLQHSLLHVFQHVQLFLPSSPPSLVSSPHLFSNFLCPFLAVSVLGRVGQSVESALIALAAIFLAHSAYFNNFWQKIPYIDVSRQKRVLFNCFATKQCLEC